MLGKRLAASCAKTPIACVYSSPIGRAKSTADTVAKYLGSVEVVLDAGLRERSFGCLEGLTVEEQKAKHPEVQKRNSARDDDYACPGGGESRAVVRKRATEALRSIAMRHPGQRVVVVTHSAWLSCMMRHVLAMQDQPNPKIRALAIPNTAINVLRWSGDGWQLTLWGDIGEFDLAVDDATGPLKLVSAVALIGVGLALLGWRRSGSESALARILAAVDVACEGAAASVASPAARGHRLG